MVRPDASRSASPRGRRERSRSYRNDRDGGGGDRGRGGRGKGDALQDWIDSARIDEKCADFLQQQTPEVQDIVMRTGDRVADARNPSSACMALIRKATDQAGGRGGGGGGDRGRRDRSGSGRRHRDRSYSRGR